jgi:biotin carboxylase
LANLLLLDPASTDAQNLLRAARKQQHPVACVEHDASLAPGATRYADDPKAPTIGVNFAHPDAAERQLIKFAERWPAAGVVTTSEFLTPLATRIADRLGLAGNLAGSASWLRNKVQMYRQLDAAGVRIGRWAAVDSEPELAEQVRRLNLSFPVVLKPADNAGSKGVTIVERPTELGEAFDHALAQDAAYGMRLDRRVIIQQYLPGREVSVESITHKGSIRHLCVTNKQVSPGAHRVEIGHTLPTGVLGPRTPAALAVVTRALRALGVRNGMTHSELIVTDTGEMYMVEVAGRIGAGRIGDLIGYATGVDVYDLMVRIALGLDCPTDPTQNGRHAASRLILSPQAGTLQRIRDMPAAGEDVPLSVLMRHPGDWVAGPESNRCRVGCFVVVGCTEAEVDARADELLGRIVVEVEPDGDRIRD